MARRWPQTATHPRDQGGVIRVGPQQVLRQSRAQPSEQEVPAQCEEQGRQRAPLPDAGTNAEALVQTTGGRNLAPIAGIQVADEVANVPRYL